MLADGVAAAVENQFIGEAQRAIPLKTSALLLFAGALLAVLVAR